MPIDVGQGPPLRLRRCCANIGYHQEFAIISDHRLQQDVLDELAFEPRVDGAHIGLVATGGVVTLSGFVGNYAGRER